MKSLVTYIKESKYVAIEKLKVVSPRTYCLCYCDNEEQFDYYDQNITGDTIEILSDDGWFVVKKDEANAIEISLEDNNITSTNKYYQIPNKLSFDDLGKLVKDTNAVKKLTDITDKIRTGKF